MKLAKSNQAGSLHLAGVMAVLVIAGVAAIGVKVFNTSHAASLTGSESTAVGTDVSPPYQDTVLPPRDVGYNADGSMTITPWFSGSGNLKAGISSHSGTFDKWTNISTHFVMSSVAMGKNNGLIVAFGHQSGADGKILAYKQKSKNTNAYQAVKIPDNISFSDMGITVGQNSDGSLQVAAIANNERVYTCKFNGSSCSAWQAISSARTFIHPQGSPMLQFARNSDGRLQLFIGEITNGDRDNPVGRVITTWQTTPSGSFSSIKSLDGVADLNAGIKVGVNANGKLTAFVRSASDYQIYTKTQTTAGDSEHFGGWLAVPNSQLASISFDTGKVSNSKDGSLYFFIEQVDGQGVEAVTYRKQTTPNGSWTSTWTSLGGDLGHGDFVAGLTPNGRMQIVAVDKDNKITVDTQSTPNGSWPAEWVKTTNQPDEGQTYFMY